MKPKIKNLLGGMLLSSVASIIHAENLEEITINPLNSLKVNVLELKERAFYMPPILKKYIIKFGRENTYAVLGHRSHSSHSSHSSHASHYSGSQGHASHTSHTSHYSSSGYSSPDSYHTPSNSSVSSYSYRLGDRSIKIGESGADVKMLSDILIKYDFLKLSNISHNSSGHVVYNQAVADAVGKFQRKARLKADGVAGSNTISELIAWKDYIFDDAQLGYRELHKDDYGDDVKNLTILLIKLGYMRAGDVYINNLGKALYTDFVLTGIKKFQRDKHMKATGVADMQTIKSLKSEFK